MLSCANNVIPQCRQHWRPFLEDPRFFASPHPHETSLSILRLWFPYLLLNLPFQCNGKSRHYDWRVLDFIWIHMTILMTTICNPSIELYTLWRAHVTTFDCKIKKVDSHLSYLNLMISILHQLNCTNLLINLLILIEFLMWLFEHIKGLEPSKYPS